MGAYTDSEHKVYKRIDAMQQASRLGIEFPELEPTARSSTIRSIAGMSIANRLSGTLETKADEIEQAQLDRRITKLANGYAGFKWGQFGEQCRDRNKEEVDKQVGGRSGLEELSWMALGGLVTYTIIDSLSEEDLNLITYLQEIMQ